MRQIIVRLRTSSLFVRAQQAREQVKITSLGICGIDYRINGEYTPYMIEILKASWFLIAVVAGIMFIGKLEDS